jgi:hypothetical protein
MSEIKGIAPIPGSPWEATAKPAQPEAHPVVVKRFNNFTWWIDANAYTVIGDRDGNKIELFPNRLDESLVIMWCHGYETGHVGGIHKGKSLKALEVKQALGL